MADPVNAKSADSKVAAVKGECTGSGGFGVWGICATGHGVHGDSTTSRGVVGTSQDFHGVFGKSTNNVGVAAESQNAEAMNAVSHSAGHAAVVAINDANGVGVQGRSGANVGVVGESNTGRGVMGQSNTNFGVSGVSRSFPGVSGTSIDGRGTEGFSTNLEGVAGISKEGTGVLGISEAGGRGVAGFSNTFQGVYGHSISQAGVVGESDQFDGVFGISHDPKHAGVSGHNPGGLAGFFEGDVEVTGDIRLANADCAEDFDIAAVDLIEPGTVMVLGDDDGALYRSQQPYDKRVAGVVSGAGDYKPAIVLDKRGSADDRKPIALLGKTYCKVDARYGSIQVGDLLTTSASPGHAMKAADPSKAFGAVIGKALSPLRNGRGLIPILIALQ
jgi:hypothetical protein